MTTGPGLRERKKAKTRAAIQAHAMRLFAEHGYDGTTIEQIAAAAEISPSTFFRYFPTKEDVVVEDDYDPALIEAFRLAASTERPIAALRAAVRGTLGAMDAEAERITLERTRLIFGVPALRGRVLQGLLAMTDLLAATLAESSGLDPDDPAPLVFAGAVTGAWMTTILRWAKDPGTRSLVDVLDGALAALEAGLDRPLAPSPGT